MTNGLLSFWSSIWGGQNPQSLLRLFTMLLLLSVGWLMNEKSKLSHKLSQVMGSSKVTEFTALKTQNNPPEAPSSPTDGSKQLKEKIQSLQKELETSQSARQAALSQANVQRLALNELRGELKTLKSAEVTRRAELPTNAASTRSRSSDTASDSELREEIARLKTRVSELQAKIQALEESRKQLMQSDASHATTSHLPISERTELNKLRKKNVDMKWELHDKTKTATDLEKQLSYNTSLNQRLREELEKLQDKMYEKQDVFYKCADMCRSDYQKIDSEQLQERKNRLEKKQTDPKLKECFERFNKLCDLYEERIRYKNVYFSKKDDATYAKEIKDMKYWLLDDMKDKMKIEQKVPLVPVSTAKYVIKELEKKLKATDEKLKQFESMFKDKLSCLMNDLS